ncbi:unnamed protein product [Nippostrongylus brasiliensis]|uniref:Uncharacterized protein n=1 Tax=Nippostrongylus brasiliensis TaxID=27835 RepID=A0A0N4Y3F3_NIPBR|nr:unnamed protein product [Nippostrongylus brasiliensis]
MYNVTTTLVGRMDRREPALTSHPGVNRLSPPMFENKAPERLWGNLPELLSLATMISLSSKHQLNHPHTVIVSTTTSCFALTETTREAALPLVPPPPPPLQRAATASCLQKSTCSLPWKRLPSTFVVLNK